MRSDRGPDSRNLRTTDTEKNAFMGRSQIAWLTDGLKRSKSVWKVIAADMPISPHVADGKDAEGRDRWEAIFGMQVMHQKVLKVQNTVPTAGLQFFGHVDIDAKTLAPQRVGAALMRIGNRGARTFVASQV